MSRVTRLGETILLLLALALLAIAGALYDTAAWITETVDR